LAGGQQALALLMQQETAKEAECRELTQQRDWARADAQEKARLEIEAGHLGKEVQEAAHEEQRAGTEADAARTALHAAEQAGQKQQDSLAWAEQQEQEAVHTLEEKRRQHEAEHLRTALHVGEPCPVCCTPVRELPPPSPEAQDDLSALQRAVATAKATLTEARQALQQTSAAAAAARMRKETAERELAEREQKRREAQDRFLSRFPRFSSLSAALGALQTQRQEITDLVKAVEAKAQAAEQEKHALSQRREK